jgi:S-DNA-T family DNA segregation ATPase FtsK/SpoIIIE
MAETTKQDEYPSPGRMIAGVLFFPLSLLLLLSLISYDWRDIGILNMPPATPPANWIGTAGAWTGFGLLMGIGIGAWLVPVWCVITGLLLVLRRGSVRAHSLWTATCLILLAALLDLHGVFNVKAAANITDNGGVFGWLITHGLLVRWLSPIGTGALLWSLFLFVFVMAVGWRNLLVAFRYTAAMAGLLFDMALRRHSDMRDKHLQLEREERELRKKQARLERELRKKELAEQIRRRAAGPEDDEREGAGEEPPAEPVKTRIGALLNREPKASGQRAAAAVPPPPAPPPEPLPAPVIDPDKTRFPGYRLPPLTLLDSLPPGHGQNAANDNTATAAILVETLSEFGIDAEVTSIKQGPVVTRYELLPAKGVRVERIAALANNLALSLKAHSLRVQAPVPGKGVVGIEIPNEVAKMVMFREVIESDEWKAGTMRLPLALGKDVGGRNVVADLAKMPHLLVAGATGAGKSVCINAILAGLFMSKTPDELRLILVDPKIVEFSMYNDLPHLVVPVITDPKKVALSLRWAITEMENRYKMFAKAKVRNIESFNNRHAVVQGELFGDDDPQAEADAKTDEFPSSVPYIVIIIDELADLMLAAGAEIENSIARLAQLSRAVGIHMIIATQRPSVNVITGTIKANFPARIAFQVAQKVDSRTILDQSGADKLLGRGDMLYLPPATSKLVRSQGTMISDAEIDRIIAHIKAQAQPAFEMEIQNKLEKASGGTECLDDGGDDELVEQAIEIIRETHRASTSSLQRRMRIGYTRAARVIDILEERGLLGPPRGSEPREILIDLDVDMANNGDALEEDMESDEEITEKDV